MTPCAPIQYESRFALDWFRCSPPCVPQTKIHKRRLFGVVGKELVSRLFETTRKEGYYGNVFGQSGSVKYLLETIAHCSAKISIDEGKFPTRLDYRDLVGFRRGETAHAADNLKLTSNGAHCIGRNGSRTSHAKTGEVQKFNLGKKFRVLNDLELEDFVRVVGLKDRLDIN